MTSKSFIMKATTKAAAAHKQAVSVPHQDWQGCLGFSSLVLPDDERLKGLSRAVRYLQYLSLERLAVNSNMHLF